MGVCAGGLGCLVKYRPGLESEHNSTGVCVTEQVMPDNEALQIISLHYGIEQIILTLLRELSARTLVLA